MKCPSCETETSQLGMARIDLGRRPLGGIMRDVLADIDRWLEQGESVAMATVVQTWGSAPRGVGSRMAISANGRISGSVSGGCVEGALVEASANVLKSNRGRLLHFGVTDETVWELLAARRLKKNVVSGCSMREYPKNASAVCMAQLV